MFILRIVFGLIGVGLALYLVFYSYKKPVEIKFNNYIREWAEPVLLGSSIIMFVIVAEMLVADYFLGIIPDSGKFMYLIRAVIRSGLIVPFVCWGLSKLFEHHVKSLHLDYLVISTRKVSTICLCIMISFVSVRLLLYFLSKIPTEGIDLYFDRSLIWIGSVIGVSVGIGTGVIGRVEEDIKIAEEERKDKRKKKGFFGTPIVMTIVISVFLFAGSFLSANSLELFVGYVVAPFLILYVVTAILLFLFFIKRIYPSERRSEKNLVSACKRYQKKGKATSRFGRMKYTITDGKVIVDDINIVYKGHEKEEKFVELFKNLSFDYIDYNTTLITFHRKRDSQEAYIKQEFKNCIDGKRRENKA